MKNPARLPGRAWTKLTEVREQPIALDAWTICYHVRKRLTLLAARAASAFNRILAPWCVRRRHRGDVQLHNQRVAKLRYGAFNCIRGERNVSSGANHCQPAEPKKE